MNNIIAKHVVRHHLKWMMIARAQAFHPSERQREREKAKRSLSTNQNAQKQTSWNLFGAGYLLITLKKRTKFDDHKMTKQVSGFMTIEN